MAVSVHACRQLAEEKEEEENMATRTGGGTTEQQQGERPLHGQGEGGQGRREGECGRRVRVWTQVGLTRQWGQEELVTSGVVSADPLDPMLTDKYDVGRLNEAQRVWWGTAAQL